MKKHSGRLKIVKLKVIDTVMELLNLLQNSTITKTPHQK